MEQIIYTDIEGREKEKFKPYTSEPDIIRPIYLISNYGRVMNIHTGKILKPFYDKDGYLKFSLQGIDGKKKKRFSHRLVALTYIPNPENKPEINHKRVEKINGKFYCIHDDNYVDNLEWCTHDENIYHSRINNLEDILYGESHGCTKVDLKIVGLICFLLELGYKRSEILKILGFNNKNKNKQNYIYFFNLIGVIKNKRGWKWASKYFNF